MKIQTLCFFCFFFLSKVWSQQSDETSYHDFHAYRFPQRFLSQLLGVCFLTFLVGTSRSRHYRHVFCGDVRNYGPPLPAVGWYNSVVLLHCGVGYCWFGWHEDTHVENADGIFNGPLFYNTTFYIVSILQNIKIMMLL